MIQEEKYVINLIAIISFTTKFQWWAVVKIEDYH